MTLCLSYSKHVVSFSEVSDSGHPNLKGHCELIC